MKISFLIHSLTYSGAPKMLAWVASSLSDMGYECEVISFYQSGNFQLISPKVKVVSLNYVRSHSWVHRNVLEQVKINRWLIRHYSNDEPDLIVTFLDSISYGFIFYNHFALRNKYKIIASERVDPYYYEKKTALIKKMILKFCNKIVFQTEGAKNYFENDIQRNSVIIPNPVIVKENLLPIINSSIDCRDKTIVSVGRLTLGQKRHDVMLDAFKLFWEKHNSYQLLIYGDGPDKEKIISMIEDKGLKNNVKLMGRISDVEKTIYKAGAFIITSDYEGIPNSLIEAMMIGVPSVATDCSPGGAKLLIENGENGYITRCGDARSLADYLSNLIDDPVLSQKISENAKKISQRFSEEKIRLLWKEIVDEVGKKN